MAKTRSTRAKRPGASRRRSSPAKSAGPKGRRGRTAASSDFRVRVRMYRHGLGDCFLVTFRREGRDPFQLLIDCGALARSGAGEMLSGTDVTAARIGACASRLLADARFTAAARAIQAELAAMPDADAVLRKLTTPQPQHAMP